MGFKDIKDIKLSATYQRNLREALAAAQDATMEFVLWQAFPFAEQTAHLIVVAPTVDTSLIRKIGDNGAHKLGAGKCRAFGRRLVFQPATSVSANEIKNALKIARVQGDVDVVGHNVDLDAMGETQAKGAPVANAAQQAARKVVEKDAPDVLKRLEAAAKATDEAKERSALTQLKQKLAEEIKDEDFVSAKAVLDAAAKLVASLETRQGAQAEFEAAVKKLQKRYDEALAAVPADEFKNALKAWTAAAKFGATHQYEEAGKFLKALPTLIEKAEDATRAAWRERLTAERDDANAQLPSPTRGETTLLDDKARAALAHVMGLESAKFEEAFKAFEAAVKALVATRRLRHLATVMQAQANEMWEDQERRLTTKAEAKVRGQHGNVATWMVTAERETDPAKVTQALKNAIKAAKEVEALIAADLALRNEQSQKASAAVARMQAAMNLSQTEDDAATLYGNGRFTGGMVKDIWKQVLNVHGDNPPNGAIAGVKSLADVEAAIAAWRTSGDSGVLTNFHVPGGGRPQAKWEKNFVRAEIQANFCVKWRGNKVNIHVEVEPRSYFAKYANEVDWSLIPQSIRTQLGR